MSPADRSDRWRRRALLAASASLTALLTYGCTGEAAHKDDYQPSHNEAIPGQKVKKVIFTADAAERVDLQTSTVRRSGDRLVVDYTALIYDGQGAPWVYTVPEELSYVRAPVRIDRVVGDLVYLHEGPPAGTQVVTVGSTEVYGSELDITGKH